MGVHRDPPPAEWIGRRENLVVCGLSGTGKTFFLEALGQAAVEAGMRVTWFILEALGVLVRRHRADDSVTKAITRILRADLAVVDLSGVSQGPSTTSANVASAAVSHVGVPLSEVV